MLAEVVAQMRWDTLRETGTLTRAMRRKGGSATRVPHVYGAACDRTQNTRRKPPRVDIEASAQQPCDHLPVRRTAWWPRHRFVLD